MRTLVSCGVLGEHILHLPGRLFDFTCFMSWPQVKVAGIRIVDPQADKDSTFYRIVSEGLELIAFADERRYARVLAEIRVIANVPTPTGAMYSRPLRVCYLDKAVYEDAQEFYGNAGATACMLVHEATHGHFFTKFIGLNSRSASRIERACNHEMLRFARRINIDAQEWLKTPKKQITRREHRAFAREKIKELWKNLRTDSSKN
jgi:hypothetical protein